MRGIVRNVDESRGADLEDVPVPNFSYSHAWLL